MGHDLKYIHLIIVQLLAATTTGFTISNLQSDIVKLYYVKVYNITYEQADKEVKSFLSLISIAILIGNVVGSLIFSLIAKFLGFKVTALIGSLGVILFSVLSCIPVNEYFLLLIRVLIGFFAVLYICPTIIIVGEHSLYTKRGYLGMWFQFGITIGIFINSLVLLFVRMNQHKFNGYWLTFIPALITTTLGFVTLYFTPDVKKRIHKEVHFNQLCAMKYRDVLLCSIFLGINQQFTGINGVIVYATETFKHSFLSEFSSVYGSLIISTVNIASTILSFLLIEKLGRRKLFFIGLCICFISQNLILTNYSLPEPSNIFLLTCSVLFIVGFAFGPGPILYVLASELFPIDAKSMLISILMTCNYSSNLIVVLIYPIMSEKCPWFNFLIFVNITMFSGFVLFFRCPETSGKTQEQIQESINSQLQIRISGVGLEEIHIDD